MDVALRTRLAGEHRSLDERFGRFLAAATSGDAAAATEALRAFDEDLRRHTALEEETLLPAPPDGRLVATAADETPEQRLSRELRLEHVQVRELSAMTRRLLDERADLAGALRLAGSLARRWDAHTTREERELLKSG